MTVDLPDLLVRFFGAAIAFLVAAMPPSRKTRPSRALLDHVTIRHHASELERHGETPRHTLHALGGALGEHVRFEERLTPIMEKAACGYRRASFTARPIQAS